MDVIVFGATGTVGKFVIEQALEKGYRVSAFSRNPSKLSYLNNPNLRLIKGDVFNAEEVRTAVSGHNAVCVVLGSGSKKSVVRSVGTNTIIAAMQQEGVKRLICQTTLGAGESQGNLNFFWKNVMFGWLLKPVFQDHELQENFVRKSGLDWTIIRPGAFTNGGRTGRYRHGFAPNDKTTRLKISRKDVADFIIQELTTDQYLHQAPGLSY